MSEVKPERGGMAPEWPYPVKYGVENIVDADVLALGGGIAGCWAALEAARKGLKVAIVEKGATIRSGEGGTGCDSWTMPIENPCSNLTPEEFTEAIVANHGGYSCGIGRYIQCKESYNTLLEMEKLGVKVRDTGDDFKGAEFRDEETKLLFAENYTNNTCIRIWGTTIKPLLHEECQKLGVAIYDRVTVTGLLTEGGKQGSRLVGATGVNVRTGEFYVFRAKAAVLCMGNPTRVWVFSQEMAGLRGYDVVPSTNVGDGHAMAWRAGAEFTLMERTSATDGGLGFPAMGHGRWNAVWYPCSIVDANGKEVPWIDRDGRVLKTISERCRPAPGQKFFLNAGAARPMPHPGLYDYVQPCLIPDLADRVQKGEFVPPFYADLPGMPEHERRAIFDINMAQESQCGVPIHQQYTRAGFDPDKDMLQSYQWFLPGAMADVLGGEGPPHWRTLAGNCGGLVVDWDLMTSVEGLFAAGLQVFGSWDHANAATMGRHAGRRAADYALKATDPVIDRQQVEAEKTRVYAPVKRRDGMEWKEFNAGVCRVMQVYCPEPKNAELLKIGLLQFQEITEGEAQTVYARNPHELMRVLEAMDILTVGEMILHASLARRASARLLNFHRTDFPEEDPPEWNKFITTRLEDGQVKTGELPHNYWLLPPNAPTYEENYRAHGGSL